MNKQIMYRWVAALRSGRYSQSRSGYLKVSRFRPTQETVRSKQGSSFCVMGVLCDLYQLHNFDDQLQESFDERIPGYFVTNFENAIDDRVPNKVLKWAGLKTADGRYKGSGSLPKRLTELNDLGYDFWAMSTIISNNYRSL